MTSENLDHVCARFGYGMCDAVNSAFHDRSKTENHITRSLGVLQEDGVYAFFLYQATRNSGGLGEQAARLLSDNQITLLPESVDDTAAVLESLRAPGGISDDLDKLLLAKRLLEQALIYARYHAKAPEDKKGG